MASIGNLVVNLTAKTDKFRKGMKQSQTAVDKFASVTKKALKVGVATSIAAIGAAAAATAVQFQKLDVIAKTSDKLGIASEKMAGLNLAFTQTGVDSRAGMVAIQRMTRRIADAANGAGPAAKTLKTLGLSAASLSQLSPDKALAKIADRMQMVSGQGEKVRIAFSLFDSEGVGLVNTLAQGSAGLRKFQRTAEGLNLAHSRDELAKVERANDAMNRVVKSVVGVFQELAIAVAPTVEVVSGFFKTAVQESTQVAKALSRAFGITQLLDSVATSQPPAKKAVQDFTGSIESMARAEEAAAAKAEELIAIQKRLQDAMRELSRPVEKVKSEVEEFKQTLMATQQGIVWDNHPLVMAMRQKESGFTSMLSNLQNELKILRGEATETGIKLQQMTDMGVDPAQVEKLRKLFAERDKILAQNRAAEEWRQKVTSDLAERNKKTAATPEKTNDQRFAGVMQKGSAEAFATVVRQMRPQKSKEATATKKVEKAVNHQSRILQAGFDAITKKKLAEQGAV